MGIQFGHVVQSQRRFAFMFESAAPGTYTTAVPGFVAPTASDFIKVKDFKCDLKAPRTPRDDSNEGFSPYERVSEKNEVPWSLETYVFGSGAAGTAGILGRLIQFALGAVPVVAGGTSVTYRTSNSSIPPIASMVEHFNATEPLSQTQLTTAVCDEFKVSASGTDKPTFSFSGKAIGHVGVGRTTVSATAGAGASVTVASPNGRNFEPGSRIQIGAQTGPLGQGFAVIAASDTAITLATAHAGVTAGDVIAPRVVTPVYEAGPLISHTTGSFTLDGVARTITGFELTVKRNLDYIEDEFGAAGLTDAAPGMWSVDGKFSLRARADTVIELVRRKTFATRALILNLGITSGHIYRFSLPRIEPEVGGITVSGTGMIDIPFVALASAAGATDIIDVIQM